MDEKQEEDQLNDCITDVIKRIANMKEKGLYDFLDEPPTDWIMKIMGALRKCAMNIPNYKEFREGLIEAAALILVVMVYSDALFRKYLSRPTPPKPRFKL